MIEGPRQLRTAIDLGAELKEVFFRPDQNQILDSLKSLEIDFYEVDPQVLDDIADSASPQGVLAVARARETAIESIAEMHRVVVIDSVQDPGNLGAIVRTAAAAGFDAVVTGPGTADLWSTRAIRASAGTLFALHMAKRVDLESSLDLLRVAGHSVLATDVRGETSVYQVEIEKRMTLVVGSEAHGLSETIIDRTDAIIRVPMGPLVESLNVAVATGIVMYRMQEEGQDE
ncbi:MAG: RNA methyltransferase [Actinomycetota bacterium]|nr:RNA methyltransferase [Actinomycetota bacterium]MED5551383.1 RNA methyltransferase [Actinomycetota bacterium]MEE2680255.1 RNA methyltransferase [Actinomycetota bacterium]MEE3187412.1 RNA methyltransferase [Actinomycetota bacterium]